MAEGKAETRSIVDVAFGAFLKAEKARDAAAKADAEAKRWSKTLNETEAAEYAARVDEHRAANKAE